MGIGNILNDLCRGAQPLLQKNEKSKTYSIRDPRYLMCIRIAMYKDGDKVCKIVFSR
jgi:hypothetical protein